MNNNAAHQQAALDDATTLIAEGSEVSTGPSSGADLWARIKRDASAKLNQSHFSLLDINQQATPAEVKKAYRQQCIAWHPDKHVSSEDSKVREEPLKEEEDINSGEIERIQKSIS